MMAEGHLAVLVAAGSGLAYVVEQGGQAHHEVVGRLGHDRDGVGEHILVPVDRILLHPQIRQFGHDLGHPAAVDGRPQPRRGIVAADQIAQLRPRVHIRHRGTAYDTASLFSPVTPRG